MNNNAHVEDTLLLALVKENRGNVGATKKVFAECPRCYPETESVFVECSRFHFAFENWAGSRQYLTKLVKLSPIKVGVVHRSGAVSLISDVAEQAVIFLNKSSEIRPQSDVPQPLLDSALAYEVTA